MSKTTQNNHVSRKSIPHKVVQQLWAKAAGRCEICNELLNTDEYTQANLNGGQIAHIIAAEQNGPRGNSELSAEERNNIENLMLLCYKHHRLIDEQPEEYPVDRLNVIKKEHEDRITLVTSVHPGKKSLIVFYEPTIGKDYLTQQYDKAAIILFPHFYPAEGSPLRLEAKNLAVQDEEELYWQLEARQLDEKLKKELPNLLEKGINHFSLFALAPQPLLVKLGTILNDKYVVDVYQKHREPGTWEWQDSAEEGSDIKVNEPGDTSLPPVLVFALSANAIKERVSQKLSDRHSIWIVTCDKPNNDMLRAKSQLSDFRKMVRFLLDDIKSVAQYDTLDVYMAMPAAFAIEFGRIRMAKADMKWRLFDCQNNHDVEAITIE